MPAADVTADDVLRLEARVGLLEKIMLNVEDDYDSLMDGLVDCEHLYRDLFLEKAGLRNYDTSMRKVGDFSVLFGKERSFCVLVAGG